MTFILVTYIHRNSIIYCRQCINYPMTYIKSLIECTSRQWLHSKPPLRDASALRNYFLIGQLWPAFCSSNFVTCFIHQISSDFSTSKFYAIRYLDIILDPPLPLMFPSTSQYCLTTMEHCSSVQHY